MQKFFALDGRRVLGVISLQASFELKFLLQILVLKFELVNFIFDTLECHFAQLELFLALKCRAVEEIFVFVNQFELGLQLLVFFTLHGQVPLKIVVLRLLLGILDLELAQLLQGVFLFVLL